MIPQSLQNLLSSKKVFFVTGKGGVGKTLVSALLSQQLASLGRSTCCVQFAGGDDVSPLFGKSASEGQYVELAPGLSTRNFTVRENLRDYLCEKLGLEALFHKVFKNSMVDSFVHAIPGLAELMFLGRIEHMSRHQDKFDAVVIDSFATGHFMNMILTPRSIVNSKITGRIISEASMVQEFLEKDPSVTNIVVGTPDALTFAESKELTDRLGKEKLPFGGLIINKSYQDAPGDMSQVENDDSFVKDRRVNRAKWRKAFLDSYLSDGSAWELPDLGFISEPVDFHELANYMRLPSV